MALTCCFPCKVSWDVVSKSLEKQRWKEQIIIVKGEQHEKSLEIWAKVHKAKVIKIPADQAAGRFFFGNELPKVLVFYNDMSQLDEVLEHREILVNTGETEGILCL